MSTSDHANCRCHAPLPPISRLAVENAGNFVRQHFDAVAYIREAIQHGREWDRPEPPVNSPFVLIGLSLAHAEARGIDAYFILRVNPDLSITIKTNLPNYREIEP